MQLAEAQQSSELDPMLEQARAVLPAPKKKAFLEACNLREKCVLMRKKQPISAVSHSSRLHQPTDRKPRTGSLLPGARNRSKLSSKPEVTWECRSK